MLPPRPFSVRPIHRRRRRPRNRNLFDLDFVAAILFVTWIRHPLHDLHALDDGRTNSECKEEAVTLTVKSMVAKVPY